MITNGKLFTIICGDKAIANLAYKNTWISGSSTEVRPYTFWNCGMYPSVEIQLDVDTKGRFPHYDFYAKDKKKLNAIIERYKAEYPNNIKDAWISPNDGSCPPILKFQFYSE